MIWSYNDANLHLQICQIVCFRRMNSDEIKTCDGNQNWIKSIKKQNKEILESSDHLCRSIIWVWISPWGRRRQSKINFNSFLHLDAFYLKFIFWRNQVIERVNDLEMIFLKWFDHLDQSWLFQFFSDTHQVDLKDFLFIPLFHVLQTNKDA